VVRPLTTYDERASQAPQRPLRAPLAERARLAALTPWTADERRTALHAAAEALGIGMGKVAQALRVAITGTQVSPDISHTVTSPASDEAAAPHRRGPCKSAVRD
jgi:glutamyl-tRNA synthetase